MITWPVSERNETSISYLAVFAIPRKMANVKQTWKILGFAKPIKPTYGKFPFL